MVSQTILISAAIVAVGLFICLFLIFRSKRKVNAIKHYEELRDKLSLREIKPKKSAPVPEMDMIGSLQSFITSVVIVGITLVIGIYVLDEIGSQMVAGSHEANVTAAVAQEVTQEIAMIPIGIVSVLMIIFGMFVVMRLIKGGLLGDSSYNEKVKKAERGIKHYKNMRDDLSTR